MVNIILKTVNRKKDLGVQKSKDDHRRHVLRIKYLESGVTDHKRKTIPHEKPCYWIMDFWQSEVHENLMPAHLCNGTAVTAVSRTSYFKNGAQRWKRNIKCSTLNHPQRRIQARCKKKSDNPINTALKGLFQQETEAFPRQPAAFASLLFNVLNGFYPKKI